MLFFCMTFLVRGLFQTDCFCGVTIVHCRRARRFSHAKSWQKKRHPQEYIRNTIRHSRELAMKTAEFLLVRKHET
jgi:hypothetical protein